MTKAIIAIGIIGAVFGGLATHALDMRELQKLKDEKRDVQVAFDTYKNKQAEDRSQAITIAVTKAKKTWEENQEKKDEALLKAEQRAKANAAAARSARAERDSLRDDLAAARRALPEATCRTVREHAAALSEVFEQCASRYQELAEEAGGLASDVRTLIDAWPRSP